MEETNHKKSLCTKHVDEWIKFSTEDHMEKEIEDRVLKDPESVCYSYLSRYCKMSEEFIDRLAVLSTGLITKQNIDTEYDRVFDCLKNDKLYIPADVTELSRRKQESLKYKHLSGFKIDDKLDWNYICTYQKISEEFITNHLNKVVWDPIFKRRDISKEFKRKHREDLAIQKRMYNRRLDNYRDEF